ncbi:MAG: hypothetical protein OXF88_11300 [Rhodobacteraceae bacterium]|nr:hypothetical protein [Paracoccaceae bacterium]MCY4139939.1 hypothetical protein [Paracoccaceae bacterium]
MEKSRPVGVEPGRFKPDKTLLGSWNRRDYADNSRGKARGFNDPGRKCGMIRLSACHAIFNSLDDCIAAIEDYIEQRDADDARPFRGCKTPERFYLVTWRKGHQKLEDRQREQESGH